MTQIPEPINWNEVKTLLEAQEKKLSQLAERMGGLTSSFDTLTIALHEVAEDMKFLKPIIKTLAPVPNELKAIKEKIERIEERLNSVDNRLKTAEARLPA